MGSCGCEPSIGIVGAGRRGRGSFNRKFRAGRNEIDKNSKTLYMKQSPSNTFYIYIFNVGADTLPQPPSKQILYSLVSEISKTGEGGGEVLFLLTPGWQEPAPLNRILEPGDQRTSAKFHSARRKPLLLVESACAFTIKNLYLLRHYAKFAFKHGISRHERTLICKDLNQTIVS